MGYQRSIENFRTIDLKLMRPEGFLSKIIRSTREKHEKVNKKHGWRDVLGCPLCKSPNCTVEFKKFGIDIMCCNTCSLRYSSKIPLRTEDIYSDEIYLPHAIESYMSNSAYRKERFGKERIELIQTQIGSLKGKRLLDIGCGTGWFLEVAREYGTEVFGQELGKHLAQWTSDRVGIKIFDCAISEIPCDIKVDVVTMFDLIEHVENPIHLINECKRLLQSDGILVIFTPNFDSLAISIMREDSNLISPAEHLTYFNEKAVLTLAQKVQLELAYYSTNGIDLGDLKSFYESLDKKDLALACNTLFNYLQPLVDAAGAGNHLRFILKMAG